MWKELVNSMMWVKSSKNSPTYKCGLQQPEKVVSQESGRGEGRGVKGSNAPLTWNSFNLSMKIYIIAKNKKFLIKFL